MSTGIGPGDGPPPKLISRTTHLDEVSSFPSGAEGAEIVWLSPGMKLAARGTAWEFSDLRDARRFQDGSAVARWIFSEAEIQDEADTPGSGPIVFGSFSFDWQEAGSRLIVPSVVYGMSDGAAWKTEIHCISPRGEPAQNSNRKSPDSSAAEADGGFAAWKDKFERVQELLRNGHLEKVVLARRVDKEMSQPLRRDELLRTLSAQFPGCYTFAFDDFIGASPELLVRRLGAVVDSIPIAGSAPRGPDEAADERFGLELMASAKDQREHELTKGAVVSALARFCPALEVEPEPSLLLLSNVQHLSTKIQGRLGAPMDCLQLVGALHPTPAVCGLPTGAALETIRAVEGFSRGRYAGPVGWMDHRGDGEWAIALRCAEISESSATLFAGAGILAESEAQSEFEETELKLAAIGSALSQA